MIPASSRATLRLRWSWIVRLSRMDLRRHRAAAIAAVVAFALAAVGLLGSAGAHATWRARARVAERHPGAELVAFLRDDLSAEARRGLAAALRGVPGVARVRLLGSDEALARMRSELGDRASLLEGVEEGFLPATLEVALQPGPRGVERADAIAWRLRRMEGIGEVDVLQTADDQRLVRADLANRALARGLVGAGAGAVLLALVLAARALRRGPADARLLLDLGFTSAAALSPAAVRGALIGGLGALLGVLGLWSVAAWGGDGLSGAEHLMKAVGAGSRGARPLVVTALVLSASGLGAAFAWWGARLPRREAGGPDAVA